MKEYEDFTIALKNLKEVYNYGEPYEDVVLAGLTAFYKVCFERSRILISRLLKDKGYPQKDTEFPRQILRAAVQAGIIQDERTWLEALTAEQRAVWIGSAGEVTELVCKVREKFYPLFCDLGIEIEKNWLR